MTRAILCGLIPAIVIAATLEGRRQPPSGATFIIRAVPAWSMQINDVLKDMAVPARFLVPNGLDAERYIRDLCGKSPRNPVVQDDRLQRNIVEAPPCVAVRSDVTIKARSATILGKFIEAHGLPADLIADVQAEPARAGGSVEPGDAITFRQLPVWTRVTLKPEVEAEAFLRAMSGAVACAHDPTPRCLASRGVHVLNVSSSSPPVKSMEQTLVYTASRAEELAAAFHSLEVSAVSETVAAPLPPTIPVHPDQWPYDARLLARIIEENKPDATDVIVGVADSGLADASGGPIPAAAFGTSSDPIDPAQTDDDRNGFADDWIGAGVFRKPDSTLDQEVRGIGDVGLCDTQPTRFAQWGPMPLSRASHGAIVSQLATGLKLRTFAPDLKLPKLVFFRLANNVCDPATEMASAPGDAVTAVEYLYWQRHASIITLAYRQASSSLTSSFESAVAPILASEDLLLVVSAGNDGGSSLDKIPRRCPMCLGHLTAGTVISRRVMVVGAATRELRREHFSSYGPETIGIFAPAVPDGAADLAGTRVGESAASTSYAAPYVTFAAALMRSFGIGRTQDIRDRLRSSTWPLTDDRSRPGDTHTGVLDLVKAAAVRHDAIEVKERLDDGTLVRRTYVGTLSTPLSDVPVCPASELYREKVYHAIRLDDIDANGMRLVHAQPRTPGKDGREWQSRRCRVEGQIRLRELISGTDMTFDLRDVSHIQVAWSRRVP